MDQKVHAGSQVQQDRLKGDRGKSGIDYICRWIPDLVVLEQFQKSETCCFKHTDPHKYLKVGAGGAYVTWISRPASKKDAVAIRPSNDVLHISEKHNALVFDKSLHEVDDVVLAPYDPRYVHVCATFQFITNYDPDSPDLPFRGT